MLKHHTYEQKGSMQCYHAQKCTSKKSSYNFSKNQGFQQCLSLSRTLSHLQQSKQQLLCLHFQIHFPFPFPAAVTATATVGRQTGHFCFCFRITCLLDISRCSQIPFYHSVKLLFLYHCIVLQHNRVLLSLRMLFS